MKNDFLEIKNVAFWGGTLRKNVFREHFLVPAGGLTVIVGPRPSTAGGYYLWGEQVLDFCWEPSRGYYFWGVWNMGG